MRRMTVEVPAIQGLAQFEVAADSRRHAARVRSIAGTAAAFGLLLGALALDTATGNEVSSSLFYVIGVAVAAWFAGQGAGIAIACLSAAAWGFAVHTVGPGFSNPTVFYWNLGAELAIYLTAAIALARIRGGLLRERQLLERLNLVKDELDRETRAVGDLQRAMLPPNLPEIGGYEWQVNYTTSTNAGGDYYDFFPLPDGRIGILISDASGHGAQAAVLMAMVHALLHATGGALTPPDRVLGQLGQQVAQTVPDGQFATACYAVLEPSSGRVEFSLAGHPPPLLLRGDEGALEELPMMGGPPLGLFPESPLEAGAITIRPGDTLVLYSDGLTEGMSPAGELFGDDGLRKALQGAGSLPLVGLRERVLGQLEAHTAGAALADDLTLLMLRRTRWVPDRIPAQRPAP